MPKASKSSASSGTRKKHAKRAAGTQDFIPSQHKPSKFKPSKNEIKKGLVPPPKKSYIPPSKFKPAPVQVDPLDSLGLAAHIPAEFVVVLRKLAKKDGVTKRRALEELSMWVSKAKAETREEEISPGQMGVSVDVLFTVLPVWLYRYPALSVHPSRRIRHLSALLHTSLLELPTLQDGILAFLRETGSETQVSQILGSWCLSAWDVDRGVAALGSRSWKHAVHVRPEDRELGDESDEDKRLILDDTAIAQSVLPFILTTIMDPGSTYFTLNPSPSTISGDSPALSQVGTPRKGASTPTGGPPGSASRRIVSGEGSAALVSRVEDDPESIDDRNARLRVSAMGVLKWIFDTYAPTSSVAGPLLSLLTSPAFWSVLHHAPLPPFLNMPEPSSESGDAPFPTFGVTEDFGAGQTIVRRAGWGIVHALAGGHAEGGGAVAWRNHIAGTESARGLIPTAVLRSAFVEPDSVVRSSMWGPLLIFLTKADQVWTLNAEFEHSASQADTVDECVSEASGSEPQADPTQPKQPEVTVTIDQASYPQSNSTAYAEFLAFLALGCNGSPVQGYPTVLVILSTIPKEILPPTLRALSEFFDALWAAIDGQALSTLATERAKGTEAFLGAWGECLVWTVRKLIKGASALPGPSHAEGDGAQGTSLLGTGSHDSPAAVSQALVSAQFGKLAGDLGKALRLDASVSGGKIAAILEKVEATSQGDLFTEAWRHIANFARVAIANSENPAQGDYALSFLAALHQHVSADGVSIRCVERLVVGLAMDVVERLLDIQPLPNEAALDKHDHIPGLIVRHSQVMEKLMELFGGVLQRSDVLVQNLDNVFDTKLPSLLSQPSFILSYLKHRSDMVRRRDIWHNLLLALGSSSDVSLDTRMNAFSMFLDIVHSHGTAATWAKPKGGELDGLAGHVLNGALDGDATLLDLAKKLLRTPGLFLVEAVTKTLIGTIVFTMESHAQPLMRDPSAPLKTLHSSLSLLLALEQDVLTIFYPSILIDVMPAAFSLAFVLPHCAPLEAEQVVSGLAKQMWKVWWGIIDDEARGIVSSKVKHVMRGLVTDTRVRPHPAGILQALPHLNPDVEPLPIVDIIPTQSELNALLSSTSFDPIDRTLAIIEPLAPSQSPTRVASRSSWNRSFDIFGFSPYARAVSALLSVLTTDRQAARENMWALYHALVLALFASEVLQVPGAESPVFESKSKVAETELREISRRTQQIAAFLLVHPSKETWHKDVVDVLSGQAQSSELDPTGDFVRLVFEQSREHNTVRDSLVLHTVLQHVLGSATKDDADLWIDLARDIEGKGADVHFENNKDKTSNEREALQTSLAVSLAVTEFAPEPPKLDRYRNELASKIAGVPSSKANTTGLRLLRRLSALAPNPESDVIFLPQQRAVYLIQTLQAWMGSDDDLDESVESEITLVILTLAPILQNVQGAHWEFVMDLIESNLENSSFNDADTLVVLSRTLRLLAATQDLTASNKYLRELWSQRSKVILVLVRDLLAVKTNQTTPAVPRAMCREQALSIVQSLPGSLMDENTVSVMCHLVTDPSVDVQKMAYQLLQQAANRRTEHLVVEAGVDSENATVIELPPELIALLQDTIKFEHDVAEANPNGQDSLAYLLAWMITFDLFTDASLRVKTAYVDQLRNLDLIGSYFLPTIFEILGVGGDGQRPFKLDAWVVDEYWIPLYDPTVSQSLRLLAAHVYYRGLLTVPSLIRTWWLELKDRQLLTAVTAFTSSYFSPVIIASELVHIKPVSSDQAPAAAAGELLTDESFYVKVALAVNEVTAIFNVDDQQVEIGVRLPADYPLRAVEVRDIRKVGVPDNLWRKWLFAVQQVVTSHNGRIVDGIGLFKKNVSLHFEGQVECAICYSIISVVDRSLPAKPCKTCRNRFHSSCLYKWFNTSHSSSCPLCRSDIM